MSEEPSKISVLPPEIMARIFGYLDIGDRLGISLVCKDWLKIIVFLDVLRDVTVKFSRDIEGVERFSDMTRRFRRFSFRNIAIGDSVIEFLDKYRNDFVTLEFTDCRLGEVKPELRGKTLRCDNLTTLDLINSEIALFAFLPNVTQLTIRSSSGISDYFISDLGKCLVKLEKLILANTVSFHQEERRLRDNPPRLLTSSTVKSLVEQQRTTLRQIDFSSLRLSSQVLLSISAIEGLELMTMQFPYQLFASHVKSFCEMQPSLTHLDLSFLQSSDTDAAIISICALLPNLRGLVLNDNKVVKRCIIEILKLQNLVKLNLSACVYIPEVSFTAAVEGLRTFKLAYLDLTLTQINDQSLFKLLKCNPKLSYLNVSSVNVSNETLNMICQNLLLLKCFILFHNPIISDSGLTGEFENSDSVAPTPLSNLKRLEVLIISENSLITNQGCIKAIRFPKLEELRLVHCSGLNFNSDFENELRQQNPCLKDFYYSN
ncbi:AAEL010314-PA [Trichonephila inaurata madagascariensis]|uniref:AAEL010314-PA n=1 Tax=Trichonephila inaurata madagascariensis TaxID=2747483 RepID=A0A8X6X1V2_9ARAC|nr:AAEL010314-PA [Trichonephila inaurata madagascariensis]